MPDAFDILGLPARFDLNPAQIERAYLQQAASAHPDVARETQQPEAGRAMAGLNDAYEALKDPESRANALLQRLGGPRKEDDKGLPDGFLIEMMETRETLEEASSSGDEKALSAGLAEARAQRDTYIAQVAQMFDRLVPSPSPEALSAIRTCLNAWRYVERLIDQVGESGESSR